MILRGEKNRVIVVKSTHKGYSLYLIQCYFGQAIKQGGACFDPVKKRLKILLQ